MKTLTRLGVLLKSYRDSNKLSIRELSLDIGIDFSRLDKLENGAVPDIDTWLIIESWLFGKM